MKGILSFQQSPNKPLAIREFQILHSLIGIADKPIGDLPVIFSENEISLATISAFGSCRFSVSDSLYSRLESGELTVVTRYVELEYNADMSAPKRIRLTGLDILDRK